MMLTPRTYRDRGLWPDGILSPQIADFRLHCAESKVKTQDGGEKCRYISGRREIWIRKSWKSKYYTQTETRRDPENNRFDAKRCFSRSPNWLRKIVNISNNATLDGLYGFWLETKPKEVYCLGCVTAQSLDKGSGNEVKAEWSESVYFER